MPRFILLFTALLVISSGCRSVHDPAEDPAAPEREPAVVPPRPSPPDRDPEPATAGPAPTGVSRPWVMVSDWAGTNNLGGPVRISSNHQPVFEVQSGHGALTFRVGGQEVRFNGMTLLLGFKPIMLPAGEPCLHELDIERNVGPLLLGQPLDASRYHRIVIDPGHGGSSTGTRSADGDLEKYYTLDWALRLAPLLATNGWTVHLTRTNDSALPLAERVAFADTVDADLFISLHFNASGGGTHQAGLETYCLTPKGMPSNLTRGFEDDWTIEYPNNTFDAENFQLAVGLHQALLKVNGGEDRGIRRARFMGVLRGQNRPAVLLEAGFLSNPSEAAWIAFPEHRQKLAEAVAAALSRPGGLND